MGTELNRRDEYFSKIRAKELFEQDKMTQFEVETFEGLKDIHYYLFQDIYPFAGIKRDVPLTKRSFNFVPISYLDTSLCHVNQMPMTTFTEIVEKYVEMNLVHPFREGNGRSMRIWLNLMLKQQLKKIIDWNVIDKEDYFLAMERSLIKDIEIKHFLKQALSPKINDRKLYMTGIDISYYYEGYTEYVVDEMNETTIIL